MFRYNYALSERTTLFDTECMREEIAAQFPTLHDLRVLPASDLASFTFLTQLSGDDQTNLKALYLGYADANWQVKLYRYAFPQFTDLLNPPLDLDFSTGITRALYKKNTNVWQGDILQTIYYADSDLSGNLSDPVIQWDTVVTYYAQSIAVTDTITWIRENGNAHPTVKTLNQIYAGQRWLDWLSAKRNQIINWLRYNVAAAMLINLLPGGVWTEGAVMAEGAAFYKDHGDAILTYISGYDQTADTQIQADTRTWLDGPWFDGSGMTIRQKFHQQMIYA